MNENTKQETSTESAAAAAAEPGQLALNKDTVQDLDARPSAAVHGGMATTRDSLVVCYSDYCTYTATTI